MVVWFLAALSVAQHSRADVKPEDYTFKMVKTNVKYSLGLIKDPNPALKSLKFLEEDIELPKTFHLKEMAGELTPVKNQGACGSCVYFAATSAHEDTVRAQQGLGKAHPQLSPQYVMDCAAREWMCNGSFFSNVAKGLVDKNGQAAEADYPYKGVNQSCKAKSPKIYGPVKSFSIIDNSPKSMFTALKKGYAVAVTVGAAGPWMKYSSGIYNACANVGTNHQVLLISWDCETSVDEKGDCKFDSNGNLPPGVGVIGIKNSWGTGYGEAGYIRTKLTAKNGSLCNNITEEAGILELGIPPVPACLPVPIADAGLDKSLILKGN